MGIFALASVVLGIASGASWYRETGVPVPGVGDVDVWGFIVSTSPNTPRTILLENYGLWLIPYTLVWLATYVEPQRKLFAPFKLNKRYPPLSLMAKEFARSARGVFIGSMFEVAMHRLHQKGSLPVLRLVAPAASPLHVPLWALVPAALFLLMWGDAHFYWTHRWLHTRWLFKNVHKAHHESFNPDPWSGLSMHWFESAVYFSSAPMVAPFLPLWLVRLTVKGLVLAPLQGHSGFGSFEHETSCNHYIHHAKFNWNYGSSVMWDKLMGTDYDLHASPEARRNTARAREAQQQAALCGAVVPDDAQAAPEAAPAGKEHVQ